jgi:hypothetical protein
MDIFFLLERKELAFGGLASTALALRMAQRREAISEATAGFAGRFFSDPLDSRFSYRICGTRHGGFFQLWVVSQSHYIFTGCRRWASSKVSPERSILFNNHESGSLCTSRLELRQLRDLWATQACAQFRSLGLNS